MRAGTDEGYEYHRSLLLNSVEEVLNNEKLMNVKLSESYPDFAGEGRYSIYFDGANGKEWCKVYAMRGIDEPIKEFYINVAKRLVDKYLNISGLEIEDDNSPPTHSMW